MFKILLDPLLSAYGVSNSNCKVYDSKLNIMIQRSFSQVKLPRQLSGRQASQVQRHEFR